MSTSLKKNQKKTVELSTNGSKKQSSRSPKPALVDRDLMFRPDSPKPHKLISESKEEREKRLAKLKKLTLKVLQAYYEDHQMQKS